MRLFIHLAVIGLVLVNATTLSAAPPNIVFILIDDMGWRDVGFAGNAFVETPHIDRIAREGIQFTQAYASAPNCAPTRACLMSGQYTPRHGVYTVIDPRHDPGQPHHKVIAAKSNEALSGDVVTIAEVLKQRDYATACFGMWNLGRGRSGPSTPTGQGFDIFREPKQLGFEKDAYFDSNGRYCSDVLTDESLQFMEANREKPFFVYLATHDVHSPLDPKPELVEKYRRKAARTGEDSAAINQAAMIDAVDANLGRVLAKIEELKLGDNTMVVFTSDNGGTPQYVAPLNGSKGALYEGGIRVPAAIWWKGIKQPGRVSDEPILSMDFYPTLTELAGAKLPTSQPIDGVSLMPLLRGEKSLEREAVFWHFPCYIGRGEPSSAVRMGDWKLIEKFQDGSFELYNLRDDVGEKQNLAKQNPAKLRELQKVLSDWQATTHAPRPMQANPAYDPSTPLNNRGGGGKKKGNKPQGQGRRGQVDPNK
ncbi:MAG: sulfatase [Planctomycetaceae bacterium]